MLRYAAVSVVRRVSSASYAPCVCACVRAYRRVSLSDCVFPTAHCARRSHIFSRASSSGRTVRGTAVETRNVRARAFRKYRSANVAAGWPAAPAEYRRPRAIRRAERKHVHRYQLNWLYNIREKREILVFRIFYQLHDPRPYVQAVPIYIYLNR